MRGLWTLLLVGLWVTAVVAPCRAEFKADVVRKAKHAAALVEVEDGTGSAFCLDAAGLFVTNEHVVEGLPPGFKLQLVLNAGRADQQVLPAYVLESDKERDLAVLWAPPKTAPEALALGDADSAYETLPVMAVGFPFGKDLALKDGEYASVTISTGHITALRKDAKGLAEIQLDASLNPGNSGGAVLNDAGQVLGVVQAGVPDANINMAIPVSRLRELLVKPILIFAPQPIAVGAETTEQEFRFRVVAYGQTGVSATMTLSTGPNDTRPADATLDAAGWYHVHAIPVLAANEPLRLEVEDGGTTLECEAADATLTVNGMPVKLSGIREIRARAQPAITLLDGTVIHATGGPLPPVRAKAGIEELALPLTRPTHITVNPPLRPAAVNYRITAHKGDTTIGEWAASIPIGTPAAPHWIAYMGQANGHWGIYVMNADGTGSHLVTPADENCVEPCLSRDGTHVLFNTVEDADYKLGVLNPDLQGGNSQLAIVDVRTKKTLELVGDASCFHPSLSPDGKRMVFQGEMDGLEQIYTADATGENLKRIFASQANAGTPDWSPDGNWIAFCRLDTGHGQIFMGSPDGARLLQVTNGPDDDWGPAFSADGRRIAFLRRGPNGLQLWAVNWDGTGLQRLTTTAVGLVKPSWSPDGRFLLFFRAGHIWIIHTDGTEEGMMNTPVTPAGWASWN